MTDEEYDLAAEMWLYEQEATMAEEQLSWEEVIHLMLSDSHE